VKGINTHPSAFRGALKWVPYQITKHLPHTTITSLLLSQKHQTPCGRGNVYTRKADNNQANQELVANGGIVRMASVWLLVK
jgi:hypothetical protein